MLSFSFALLCFATPSPVSSAANDAGSVEPQPIHSTRQADEYVERYRSAAADENAEALAELWREAPGRVLVTIDADLEASLAMWEETPESPDSEAIGALHERALFGARIASSALNEPIFLDYASSFIGWDDDQKRSFRAGQQAYGKARRSGASGDHEESLEFAQSCTACAEPLGDWWGTAMGLLAEAQALHALERHGEALVAASRARLLYHQLGLSSSEVGALNVMAMTALGAGRPLRAHSAANAMIDLFGEEGPAAGRATALTLRAQAERELGWTEAADESAAEAKRLAGN